MTETEWNACTDPRLMLEFLRGKASDRKLRLFGCACVRRLKADLDEYWRSIVEVSERFADGKADSKRLRAVRSRVRTISCLPCARQAANKAWHAILANNAWEAARDSSGYVAMYFGFAAKERLNCNNQVNLPEADLAEKTEAVNQAFLMKEIIGNPFRPYPTTSWPTHVINLAEALYKGQDCGFALHDALLEAGHPELAEHFRAEQWHPKGGWVLDLLLGKK